MFQQTSFRQQTFQYVDIQVTFRPRGLCGQRYPRQRLHCSVGLSWKVAGRGRSSYYYYYNTIVYTLRTRTKRVAFYSGVAINCYCDRAGDVSAPSNLSVDDDASHGGCLLCDRNSSLAPLSSRPAVSPSFRLRATDMTAHGNQLQYVISADVGLKCLPISSVASGVALRGK